MSDRLCIHSNGELQTRVSAPHILTCCNQCGNGCFGGYPSLPFEYWKSSGIPSGGLYMGILIPINHISYLHAMNICMNAQIKWIL